MRYTTTLILALVVIAAVVLVAVYYDELTGERKPDEQKQPTAAKRLLENIDLDDLTEATLEAADAEGNLVTKLAVTKTDDQWRLTKPVAGRADDYTVRNLLRAAVEGTYRLTLEPGAKGQPTLADLDLAPPAYRLTIKGKVDGEARTETVEIGRKAAVGGGVYVRLADADHVVKFEKDDLLTRARQPLRKFRDTNLVDLKRDDVIRITLATPATTLRLDRAADENDRWVLAEPKAARADPDAVSDLLRTAVGLMAADFVEDGARDLSRYGLAKPRLVVTLYKEGEKPKDDDKKKDDEKAKDAGKDGQKAKPAPEPVKAATLAFGAWADLEQKSVYALIDEAGTVVSVEKSDFTKLDKSLADLRDRHVLALDADRAEEVTVDVPAELAETGQPVAYTLTKRQGAWTVRTKGTEPMKADPDAVKDLLKELADLKVLYFAEGEHAGAAKGFKPVGSVRIQAEKKAAAVGFEFGERAGDVPALVRNLREDWVGRINEKDLEHLNRDWLQMLDKQVTAFDADRATRLAIRGPDRTNVFEKKDDAWTMTAPVREKPRAGFVTDRLDDLKDLKAEKVLAATTDFKKWNLADGQLAVTVTLKPESESRHARRNDPHPGPPREGQGRRPGRGPGPRLSAPALADEGPGLRAAVRRHGRDVLERRPPPRGDGRQAARQPRQGGRRLVPHRRGGPARRGGRQGQGQRHHRGRRRPEGCPLGRLPGRPARRLRPRRARRPPDTDRQGRETGDAARQREAGGRQGGRPLRGDAATLRHDRGRPARRHRRRQGRQNAPLGRRHPGPAPAQGRTQAEAEEGRVRTAGERRKARRETAEPPA